MREVKQNGRIAMSSVRLCGYAVAALLLKNLRK